jgi:hypothetical protein
MYKAIQDNKIIAISEKKEIIIHTEDGDIIQEVIGEALFPCLVFDEVIEDTDHTCEDYIHVDGEFVLKTDDKAIRQEKDQRIAELKQYLAEADYWGQKYLDGEYTDEEWAEKVAQRKAWREEIRSLENA